MEVKPGYKQTEVGVIPEGWELSSVGREYEIKLGKMLDAKKNVGVPKPYLGNRAVQWDRIDVSDLPTVPMSRADLERFRLRKDDLLVCEGGEVGRAAIWEAPLEECYYQKALHRLRPLRGFNSQLMAAFLRRWSDCGMLANYVTQTSIAHLPREKFLEVPMPVPPPPEQHAIAITLSDVDGLLDGVSRLIAKKRDLKQAAIQQLLTAQTRLPGFHGEWEVKTLGKLLQEIGDGATPSTAEPRNFGGRINWVVIDDIKDEITTTATTLTERGLQSCAATLWQPGTLILSTGATIGEVGIARVPVATKQGICGLVVNSDEATPIYLKYWFVLNKSSLLSKAQGSTIKEVRAPTLVKFELRTPSVPEQTAIAEVLTEMDGELAALEQRREKTRALRQAMMQELLTGRIRLVGNN